MSSLSNCLILCILLNVTQTYLTTIEAADVLGVSKQHVAKLAAGGVLEVALRAPGPRGALFFDPGEVARVATERNL